MEDYSFIECRISKENIGEHEMDNSFLAEPLQDQIGTLKKKLNCQPIGICYELPYPNMRCPYYPLVCEDKDGNRFWVHWDVDTFKEYKEAGLI